MYIHGYKIGLQEVSGALMILFAMAAMFFLGYQYSYSKAIRYANEQMDERIDEFKFNMDISRGENPDFLIGNIDVDDIGVEEK